MARSSKFAGVLRSAFSIVARQDIARRSLVVSALIALLWSTGMWDFGTYEITTQ
jgi:hypothetical protein